MKLPNDELIHVSELGVQRILRQFDLPTCIDPDEMFAELEGRGIRFDFTSGPAEASDPLLSKVSR